MNSSAFIPTQYASPASPSTSSGTFYEGDTPFHCSSSCPDGFVAPQPSSWSHTPLLGWSYADSELRSPAISDVELYGTFLTGELAYTNAFSNEPCINSFIHPGTLHALAHDPTHDALLHTSPLDHGYAFSAQSDAFYPSVPMDSTHKQTYPIAAPPCIAPTLIESLACSEREFSPSDDEIANYVKPQHVQRTRVSRRVDIRASSDSPLPSPYPSPSPEPYPRASSELIACRRRNAPAFPSTTTPSNRWKCPHCPYVQRNRRSPDLKRHVETHTRGAHVAAWVCCGVPAESAVELGVPPDVVRDAPLFDFDGVTMVGGCRKVFSRRDALIRHLRKRKGACYGDAVRNDVDTSDDDTDLDFAPSAPGPLGDTQSGFTSIVSSNDVQSLVHVAGGMRTQAPLNTFQGAPCNQVHRETTSWAEDLEDGAYRDRQRVSSSEELP